VFCAAQDAAVTTLATLYKALSAIGKASPRAKIAAQNTPKRARKLALEKVRELRFRREQAEEKWIAFDEVVAARSATNAAVCARLLAIPAKIATRLIGRKVCRSLPR
jgi:hypothetical protein